MHKNEKQLTASLISFSNYSSVSDYSLTPRRLRGPGTPSSAFCCSDLSPAPLKAPDPPQPGGLALQFARTRRSLSHQKPLGLHSARRKTAVPQRTRVPI